MEVSRIFNFSASHFLTRHGASIASEVPLSNKRFAKRNTLSHGKCENLHGHNYKLIVTIEGEVHKDGMVMDFADIKKIVNEKALNDLDHSHLNEILENPSSENLAVYIWDKLKKDLPLKKITIYETENCFCEYKG